MKSTSRFTNSPLILVCLSVGLLLIASVGYSIGRAGLGYREMIAGVIALAGLALVFTGERGVVFGLVLWISMFAIGFRTMHVTSVFAVHPLVIFMLLLVAVMVVNLSLPVYRRSQWLVVVPPLLLVFGVFWPWGWYQGLQRSWRWDAMLSEFLNVAMFVPIFLVAGYALTQRSHWRAVLSAFFGVGTLIALLGSLEYALPGIRYLFPGYISGNTAYLAEGGFLRATFAFWGSSAATFICALALPLVWPLWHWAREWPMRLLLVVAFAIQLLGIYIGGYRSLWVILGLAFMAVLYLRRGIAGALLGAGGGAAFYFLVPQLGQERLLSLVLALQGNFQDTSTVKRWDRIVGAWEFAVENPLGVGWSGSGWVHSDFVQVAANLGMVAGAVFLIWYLATLIAAWRVYGHSPHTALTAGLVGSFLVVGGLLVAEGVEVLAQLCLPAWFVWAMVEIHLKQMQTEVEVGA
jgi:hypothetical protein